MRSDIVNINNAGKGFEAAVDQARKTAEYAGVGEDESIRLQILTEEMLSLACSITGALDASFWIELEGGLAVLHMRTRAVLNREQRAELIASSTSRKNEAAKTFLGTLRDAFEQAMAAEPAGESLPSDVWADLPAASSAGGDWDGYERSVLRSLADDIRISIQKGIVEITVSKRFSAVY